MSNIETIAKLAKEASLLMAPLSTNIKNIALEARKLLTIWKVQVVTQVLSTVLSFIQDKSIQIIVSVFMIGSLIANIVFLIQFYSMTGEHPDAIVACVGGGSNSAGFFAGFLDTPVDIYGVEPLGKGTKLGDHAASLQYGTEGIMHGFNSIMLKDENGDPAPVYSVASGLDYPSSGPEHAFLHDIGRVTYDVINDEDAIDAFFELSKLEGIIPAIESSHAIAYAINKPKNKNSITIILIKLLLLCFVSIYYLKP